jgi:hypothetical protein
MKKRKVMVVFSGSVLLFFLFYSLQQAQASPHHDFDQLQEQDEEIKEVSLIDINNFITLANETRSMDFEKAKRSFSIFINGMMGNGQDPICFNDFAKGIMRMTMAYVAIYTEGNPLKNHILLDVLKDQLKILEIAAEKDAGQLTEKMKIQIKNNAGKKLFEKNYGIIIYYNED